jgi:hypothetical protein
VPVYYEGGVHPIVGERHFEGLVDSDGHWKTVETGEWLGNEYYRFDYASTRVSNEIPSLSHWQIVFCFHVFMIVSKKKGCIYYLYSTIARYFHDTTKTK